MNNNLIVIDDDTQFSNLLGAAARAAGFETTVCNDAREYFDQGLFYHVMVLDLNMPTMDGVEVIRQLGKAGHKIHLILVSGYDASVLHSAVKLAEEHHLNVVGSLTKPLQISVFINMLSTIDLADHDIPYPIGLQQETITAQELLEGIKSQQMILFYQPQIALDNNALAGVEALVRWQHPTKGLITPAMFIALAEAEGMMDELTTSIINMAIHQSNIWKTQGLNITVSVNVSAKNITSLSLPEQLTEQINHHGLNPGSIMLEITESALMGELKTSLDILTRLRMKGFGLSIDDFGTGNSSLVLLHRVPFTELKIDMSFVKHMIADADAYSIVETCVMLAHKLNMTVVAEGIESDEIQKSLAGLGCNIGQGYHIAKPMPAAELTDWVRTHNK
ncbi:MAG: EAL domain-containing response regulator [Gammaproteobacteria bacterium]|nr:EAL domain-containing response regulator [Gammaproteobacteria bacterium]